MLYEVYNSIQHFTCKTSTLYSQEKVVFTLKVRPYYVMETGWGSILPLKCTAFILMPLMWVLKWHDIVYITAP